MADTIRHYSSAYDEIRDAWDCIAHGYDTFNTHMHMWRANEGFRTRRSQARHAILGRGSGQRRLKIPAARLGWQVLPTDASPLMLERLDVGARDEVLDPETRVVDGHNLDLESDPFDMSGSQFGVMLFPDMPRGIAELVRVKSNSLAIPCTPSNPSCRISQARQWTSRPRRFNRRIRKHCETKRFAQA